MLNKRPRCLLIFWFSSNSQNLIRSSRLLILRTLTFSTNPSFHFLSLLVLFKPNFHDKIAHCCIYFSSMLSMPTIMYIESNDYKHYSGHHLTLRTWGQKSCKKGTFGFGRGIFVSESGTLGKKGALLRTWLKSRGHGPSGPWFQRPACLCRSVLLLASPLVMQ